MSFKMTNLFIYLFVFEKESRGRGKGRRRAHSALSSKPYAWLDLRTPRLQREPKSRVGGFTNLATQVPQIMICACVSPFSPVKLNCMWLYVHLPAYSGVSCALCKSISTTYIVYLWIPLFLFCHGCVLHDLDKYKWLSIVWHLRVWFNEKQTNKTIYWVPSCSLKKKNHPSFPNQFDIF